MKLKHLAAAALLGLTTAPAVDAATLAPDTGWATFLFDGAGSAWSDSFTFTLTSKAILKVADAFLSGDQFEVFINGITAGPTSAPLGTGEFTADYDVAFSDATWSSGQWLLEVGDYTVSGIVALSPFGSGGAGIQLSSVSAVPLPAGGLLLIGALGGVALLRRRKA